MIESSTSDIGTRSDLTAILVSLFGEAWHALASLFVFKDLTPSEFCFRAKYQVRVFRSFHAKLYFKVGVELSFRVVATVGSRGVDVKVLGLVSEFVGVAETSSS